VSTKTGHIRGKNKTINPKGSVKTIAVRPIRTRLGLSQKLFSRLTGYSERAIAAWESGRSLSEASRQRMIEMQRMQSALSKVMRAGYVGEWLNTENVAFDGLKPLEVIERGKIDLIWRMIYELESGMPT